MSKGQTLETVGQTYSIHGLIEVVTKGQVLEIGR